MPNQFHAAEVLPLKQNSNYDQQAKKIAHKPDYAGNDSRNKAK
jgi:hypothetical protein